MSLFTNLIPTLNRTADRPQSDAPVATVKPAYDVQETADGYSLTVRLPGVTKAGLELTAEDGRFTIRGTRAWQPPEGWSSLHRETADAAYTLTLTHDQGIDADKISAELKDGVLHVTLPKTEAVKPRKIAVA